MVACCRCRGGEGTEPKVSIVTDTDTAFDEWLRATQPCEPPRPEEAQLRFRRLGAARAVLEREPSLLVLCRLETDPGQRGRGAASALVSWLTGLCDRHRVTLLGQARTWGNDGLSQEQLLAWYQRRGFEVDQSSAAQPLVWYPRRPR